MIKDKKIFGLLILILIVFLLMSLRFFFLLSPLMNEEKEVEFKSPVLKQSYSIYNGTDPEIIAERIAGALNESPIKSKHKESCCGGTNLWKFELQDEIHFSIETKKLKNNNSIIVDMSLGQSNYREQNLSYDAEYAKQIVLNFAQKFLEMFDEELGDNYEISVYSWHANKSWRVYIYQIYDGKLLNGSGFHATINRENGEIRSMDFGEWLNSNDIIDEQISIDDGKMIIYNELKEDNFNISVPYFEQYYDEDNNSFSKLYDEEQSILINISDIKFIEYRALWGRLGYKYEINFQINETKTCSYEYIIDAINGKKLHMSTFSDGGGSSTLHYNSLI